MIDFLYVCTTCGKAYERDDVRYLCPACGKAYRPGIPLVGVLTEHMSQDGGVYAVYPHSRHLSPKVRAFVDFLAERFGPRPAWDRIE